MREEKEMKKKEKDITDLLLKLYQEVTPRGKVVLDNLVDKIIFQLECVRMSLDLEEIKK